MEPITPVSISVESEDLALLKELLDSEQDRLLVEIRHTDHRSYRDQLRQGAPDLLFVHLHGPASLLASRLQSRAGHYMPASLLQSQLDTLEPPQADEAALHFDITQPAEAIVAALLSRLARP